MISSDDLNLVECGWDYSVSGGGLDDAQFLSFVVVLYTTYYSSVYGQSTCFILTNVVKVELFVEQL